MRVKDSIALNGRNISERSFLPISSAGVMVVQTRSSRDVQTRSDFQDDVCALRPRSDKLAVEKKRTPA